MSRSFISRRYRPSSTFVPQYVFDGEDIKVISSVRTFDPLLAKGQSIHDFLLAGLTPSQFVASPDGCVFTNEQSREINNSIVADILEDNGYDLSKPLSVQGVVSVEHDVNNSNNSNNSNNNEE